MHCSTFSVELTSPPAQGNWAAPLTVPIPELSISWQLSNSASVFCILLLIEVIQESLIWEWIQRNRKFCSTLKQAVFAYGLSLRIWFPSPLLSARDTKNCCLMLTPTDDKVRKSIKWKFWASHLFRLPGTENLKHGDTDTAKQSLHQPGQIYILFSICRMRNTVHKSQPAERWE